MGFRLFKKEKKKEVGLEELEEILKEEIEAHKREVERFAEENYSNLKEAVEGLLHEIDSIKVEVLPQRLKGVTKNFISMMRKQWQVEEKNPTEFFEEVSGRAAKLAVSMRKAFRIIFAIKLPEFEGINQKIKEVTSILSAYEEKKSDQSILIKQEILEKIEELKELEHLISKAKDKIERLEVEKVEGIGESGGIGKTGWSGKAGDAEETEETGKTKGAEEYREKEEELKRKLSRLESDLQKKLGMVRKPLRIYAHMVGERLEIASYRDLERMSFQKLAEKARSEILKGTLEVKDSQKEGILKSLEFIARGETKRVIEEIDSLKKEISALQAKIKTIESKKRSEIIGKKQKVEKEITSLRRQLENYVQKRKKLKGEIKKITESLPYNLLEED
ncbi:MAG: hypothetical protein H0Z28_08835 [Archaeoglobus sp.]|nr:hypothetical protein [Archaeoglobus sp.]